MGNIVSNSPAIASPPPAAQPIQSIETVGIEGIGEQPPQPGFHVDPFGPNQNPPSLPVEVKVTPIDLPSITPPEPQKLEPAPTITGPTQQTTNDQTNAADIISKMPDIYQMMKDLEKSGCLLPELNVQKQAIVDSSPLAALQPQRLKDKGTYIATPVAQPVQPTLPEIKLANTQQAQVTVDRGELPLFVFASLVSIVQTVQGITQTLYFAKLTYPIYEQKIIDNVVTTTEMNTLVIKATIIGLFAVCGGIMGGLILVKRTRNSSFLLYLSIGLIILNFCAQNLLGGKELVSGNPLALPQMLSEILSVK